MQQMQQRSECQIDFFLCAVLQGFQHGIFVEELLSGQVSDGAGHPEDAVMGAGREAQRVVRSAEELLGTGGHPADPAHLPGRELGVAADALEAGGGITPGLDLAGLQHLLAQGGTALGRGGGVKLIEATGSISTQRSMRSSSGPDTRLRYCRTALGEQVQARVGWP